MLLTLRTRLLASSPEFIRSGWKRLEASPIGYRLAKGAFWSLVGTMASRVLILAASVLGARMLGKEGFGELGMIQSTIGMFGTLSGFGLGMTATKHVAEFRTTNPARAGRILRMSSLMCWISGGLAGVALAACAGLLAAKSLAAPQLTNELRLSALYLLLSTVNGGQMGALSGFEAFRRIAGINWILGLLTLICLPVGCWIAGLQGAVWGLVISQGAACWFSWRGIVAEAKHADVPTSLRGWTSELPLLWRFSLPTALTALLGMPVAWICQALLARQPDGYRHVADFYSSMQLRNIPLTAVGVLVSAILPVYANARAQQGAAAQKNVLKLTQRIIMASIFPLLLVMGLLAGPLLHAYGKDFQSGTLVLRILLLSVAFEAIANTQVQVMVGNNLVWQVFVCYVVGSLTYLSLSFGLIPAHIGIGLAWATVGWQAVRWIGSSLYSFTRR